MTPERPQLYAEVKGPLGAPLTALQALRENQIDVIALDSFFLDLLRLHEPAQLQGIRTVATTAWTPIPLLVAAAAVELTEINRLRHHLFHVHEHPAYTPLLAATLLSRFTPPNLPDYDILETMAAEAARLGYEAIR